MSSNIPFVKEMNFNYGTCASLTPLIRRVIAENPGPFTFHGTGTYIVGHGKVAVIDPGPDLRGHIEVLLKSLKNETITHLIVTHTHRDHSPATKFIKDATGAKTYGFGPHGIGTPTMLNDEIEEGADYDFVPDVLIRNGDTINGSGWTLEAIHTPGHTSNHMCFSLLEEAALFSGDHVMGWSTTVVSPPDGDMAAYLNSLNIIVDRIEKTIWPTHGPPILNPTLFIHELIKHREEREDQILTCLKDGTLNISSIVSRVYHDIDPVLYPAAGRSVLAHLIHMVDKNQVQCNEHPDINSNFSPVP